LLDNDIQVALVYGDCDARCPWTSAENVSLTVDYRDAQSFRGAGYADLETNADYTGGVVRQYDGFSFARAFDAGHSVSAFQPETSYEIFNHVMFRHDIATGHVPAGTTNSGMTILEESAKARRKSSRIARFHGAGAAATTKRDTQRRHTPPTSHYQSQGPSSSWSRKNVLPASPLPLCNVWAAAPTCTKNQLAALANGTAETHDFVVTSPGT